MALFDRYKNRTNHAEAAPMTDDLFGGDVAVEEQTQVAVIEEAPAVALEDRDTEALPQDMEETEGEDHLISQEAESSDDGASGNRPPPGDFQSIITSDGDGGDSAEALRFAERAYLEYAMSVVKGRALPSCQDGQKPVQRRILYAMRQMGLTDNAKPVKSARVVGDVLGKYHPHGDSSAYEAAVRLSQEFTMRYPLIDGQGNFGSRDGDNAAAMRYTEMRLTPISELLLSEIDQDTVDFMPNYDGAFKEPAMLPARLPVLLMNGSEGVAVGMATKIPPHNLAEVSEAAILAVKALPEARCIKDENGQWVQEYDESSEFGSEQSNKPGRSLSFDKVMGIIQGPDFPEGGQVISSREDVLETYRTGRGSLRMRARWEIEQMARGQYRIAITELPYGEATTKIMAEIDALYNPQVKKGKKALDQDQINKKQKIQSMLDLIRNESGERVRIVIEPKTSKVDPQELMNFLLINTSLETSFPVNMTMVGVDGKPTQKGIVDILTEWAGFRFATVTRRTAFMYDKAMARIHILEGRRIAFLHIEEIIRVIREADDPKQELIDAFKLTEIQAEDILEIRLRQLARLEGIKIENEIASLKAEADGLNELLGNPASMKASIVAQMRADIKKYGDDRRTLIEPVERVKVELTSMVADEPTTIILSKHGWIRSRQGHGLDLSNIGFKPGDSLLSVIETRTVNPLIFLDTKGRSYSVLASAIPGGKGDGVPLTTLIDLQEQAKVSHMFSGGPEDRYLFAGDRGYGFIAPIAGLIARNKAGKAFMTLGDSESDSGATSLPPVAVTGETWLCARSSQNRMLVFKLDEMKELRNGGKGVMIMDIPDGEKLTQLSLHQDPLSIEVKGPRGKVNTLTGESLGKYILKRARKGAMI